MRIRNIVKRTLKYLFLILVAPLYLLFICLAILGQEDSIFQGFSQALSLIPGKFGSYTRAAFYRLACPGTSDDIYIGFLTLFSHRNTTLKRGVYIGPQCNIGKCSIGEDTLVGSGVHILSGAKQHNFGDPSQPIQHQGGSYEKISIGEDCWIGNGSVIISNLEKQSVVACGSVVTRSFTDGDVLAGNPAVRLRNRIINDQIPNKKPDQLKSSINESSK